MERELFALGFEKVNEDYYSYQGINQKFIAKIVTCNPPDYYTVYKVTPEIDTRVKSGNFGNYYWSFITDCSNIESVQKAIQKYDLPEYCLIYTVGGVIIKNLNQPTAAG